MDNIAGLSDQNYIAPEWDKARRTHDWRNYIGERAQALWSSFSDAQKLALALDAQDRADNEDWD